MTDSPCAVVEGVLREHPAHVAGVRLTFADVHALAGDDTRVVAHYASAGTLVDGSPYANSYLSLVTVDEGKIVEWIEFCDAEPLVRGIGVLQAAA